MSGQDVILALKELGFDRYEEELKEFLKNYNSEKEDLAQQVKARKRAREDEDD